MELKKDKYVRTKDGEIAKIVELIYFKDCAVYKLDIDKPNYAHAAEDFIDAKDKVIDLITLGDIVNGYSVREINFYPTTLLILDMNDECGFSDNYIKDKDIKTILTKEKYEKECYTIRR